MRLSLFFLTYLLSILIYSQNDKVVSWFDENAITIEDANPNTQLFIFKNNVPEKFENAKIFGFGEATHHGKEFFDLKAKFFKYLVEAQNVKVFIIEDSYPSEAGINEWISGGKGDPERIAQNFSIVPWYCKEVVNLLEWMRNYNLSKKKDEQIRFYGMDIQNVNGINTEIRDLVIEYKIPVSQELLFVADKCAEKKVEYNKSTDWADIQIPKLNEIKRILLDYKSSIKNHETIEEVNVAIRALNYLSQYTYYVQNNYSQDRDLKMFENVEWIIDNKSKNAKVFIWAHNEHINNQGFGNYSKRSIYNLGRHLKEKYKDKYYSVGFDFGKGSLGGYVFNEEKSSEWKTYEVNQPFPKTYAETLIEAKNDIYFIDMSKALNEDIAYFFKKKKKQMVLVGAGYNPNKNNLYSKKFSEMYDGLIFVKIISVPNYKLSEK
jgi:erythromycin esterase